MVAVVIIVIIIVFILLISSTENGRVTDTELKAVTPEKMKQIPTVIEAVDGEKWILVKHTILFHRKTFIKGKLISKFYGELDYVKESQGFIKEKYFDFTLYDAEITDSLFRTNNEGMFPEFTSEELFPGKVQPSPLPCKISYKNIEGEFEIILYELKLANIDFNKHRQLHQDEDDQVFGTVEADITGHILEEFTEEYEEKVKLGEDKILPVTASPVPDTTPTRTNKKTGRTKIEREYSWDEYWYSNRRTTYWGNPKFIGRKEEIGCLSILGPLIGIVLVLLFLFAIGPVGIIGLLCLAGIVLFIAYFSELVTWLFRIAGVVMLLFAIFGLIASLQNENTSTPKPFGKDETNEVKKVEQDKTNPIDSLIVHHRIWKDYVGTEYEGDIYVKVRDFKQSIYFKNNLVIESNSLFAYDRVLFDLKNQDSSKLYGVYKLLDSIKENNNQSNERFAETIVSFIQDIPYAIVLDNGCDAEKYNDEFTKAFLRNNRGDCDGFQKFGINSPVEFMGTLKGDCDTRTLLLYTMLAHYEYDVAVLSSEAYSHSILAINLPFSGKSITANGKRYVIWETTSPGIKAGLLPEELSEFSNWRISLISKP